MGGPGHREGKRVKSTPQIHKAEGVCSEIKESEGCFCVK